MREPTKKDIMNTALKVFNSGKFPTVASIMDGVLVIRWKLDTDELESGTIPGNVIDCRYVAVITGKDTWAGFDTDCFLRAAVKIRGTDFPKEYDPERIHKLADMFFGRLGFEKEDRGFDWALLDEDYKSGCIAAGITGLAAILFTGGVLFHYGAGLAALCIALFLPVAACLILALSGIIRMPAESVRRVAGAMMMLSGFVYLTVLGLIWSGILG